MRGRAAPHDRREFESESVCSRATRADRSLPRSCHMLPQQLLSEPGTFSILLVRPVLVREHARSTDYALTRCLSLSLYVFPAPLLASSSPPDPRRHVLLLCSSRLTDVAVAAPLLPPG